ELCLKVGDAPQLFPTLVGLWWFHEVKPDLRAAYELAQQLLTLAKRAGNSGQLIQAHRTMGHTLYWRGEFASARAHLERAIALYDPQEHRSLALTYGEQAGVQRLGDLSRSDQALRRALENNEARPFDRAELRAVLGRNAKSQWVAEWRGARRRIVAPRHCETRRLKRFLQYDGQPLRRFQCQSVPLSKTVPRSMATYPVPISVCKIDWKSCHVISL